MAAVATAITGRNGQKGEGSNFARGFFVRGATTEVEAITAVAAIADASIDIGEGVPLPLTHISIEETSKAGYYCDANYGRFQAFEPRQAGESQFNFEVAIQPVKIVVPLQPQTAYPAPGKTVPRDIAKWLIGQQDPVTGVEPEGCEVFEPVTSFSETHWLQATSISESYKTTLMRTVGKINSGSFKSFEPGEVLCSGVSGSRRGADDWELGFRFMVRENQTDIEVAGVPHVNKKGWQYLWPRYELKKDDDAFVLSHNVAYVVVADVFREANFASLGIGT